MNTETSRIQANIKGIEVLLYFNGLGNITEVKEMRPNKLLSHLSFNDYHKFSNYGYSDYKGWVVGVLTIRQENLKNIDFIDNEDDFESIIVKCSKTAELKNLISLVIIKLLNDKQNTDNGCTLCKWFSRFYKVPSLNTEQFLYPSYIKLIVDVWIHLYYFDSIIINDEEKSLIDLNVCDKYVIEDDELENQDLNLRFKSNSLNLKLSRNELILYRNKTLNKNEVYMFNEMPIAHNLYKKSSYLID